MSKDSNSFDLEAIFNLLPVVLQTITTLTAFVHTSATTLQQSAELTPEQEKIRDQVIAFQQSQPAWQQD